MKRKIILSGGLIALVFLYIQCSFQNEANTLISEKSIAILDNNSDLIRKVGLSFQEEGFVVNYLTIEQACDSSELSSEEYFLFVIPEVNDYPEKGEKALIKFIEKKGNLLVLGTPKIPGDPLFETVSPHYKMYPMHDISTLEIIESQGVFTDRNLDLPVPSEASSCFRRPTGKGFQCGYHFRWIPVLTAHDKDGLERGTVAWMLINNAPIIQDTVFKDALRRLVATTQGNEAHEQLKVEGFVFAVCAINDEKALSSLAETSLFTDMAKRISQGIYLSHAGAQEFSYWPGEEMKLGASVVNYSSSEKLIKARISVRTKNNKKIVLRKTEKFRVQPNETLKESLGMMEAESNSEGYIVRTELLLNGEIIDIIEYEVGVLSTNKEPKEEFISVEGTRFKLKGEDWYPVGANYWPRSAIATEQIDYLYHWLTPGYYDPEQLDDDLKLLKSMGASFIAIRADYLNNRRTLLDFMARCRKYEIYVYLFLQTHEVKTEPHYFEGIMMPHNFQEPLVADFIRDTRIVNNPALMAWDLIWEPSVWLFQEDVTMFGWNGDPNFRNRWDKDWEIWINERYGSLKNAEAEWKFNIPRTTEGKITSPSSKQFETDGPWRIMIAAYRRFMNNLVNRQYNDACRTLRQLDSNHLISYRQGNLPPNDYTLTSTLKHIDFFSMEAYSFPPKENGLNKVGFVNRYLSYALKDKPFMWIEYGYGGPWGKHTRHLDGEDIVYQCKYVEMVNSEAYKNGANGIAPWWFAGGLRASEKTDFGITTPEGTLRPSGESVKKYAELYRTKPPKRPEPDTWLTIDLDRNSGGLWYITNTYGADAYQKASEANKCLGIRTSGTGTTSANTPLLAVGNTKYNGKNPPKYLDAEFNWFKVKVGENDWIEIKNGEKIEVPVKTTIKVFVSVGNLQEASWLAPDNNKGNSGAVFLASTKLSGLEIYQSIDKNTPWQKDTDFGGEFKLTDGISKETYVELQMTAKNRAWFGEKISFLLVPTSE